MTHNSVLQDLHCGSAPPLSPHLAALAPGVTLRFAVCSSEYLVNMGTLEVQQQGNTGGLQATVEPPFLDFSP